MPLSSLRMHLQIFRKISKVKQAECNDAAKTMNYDTVKRSVESTSLLSS